MVLLGLLLMAAAVAAVVLISADDSPATMTTVTVLDRVFELDRLEVFLAGAGAALVFVIGLAMVSRGARRMLLRRREESRYRAAARERLSRLENEKRELERKLDAEHAASTAPTAPAEGRPAPNAYAAPEAQPAPPAAPPSVPGMRTPPQEDRLVAGSPRPRDQR
ncbi:ABC-type nickel/cobalt efflux system permease component RcnA [Thermocatellispora tengchongensis]|uniref:ABC-type nickel/cobalt efflux system permease component RcnA n=1 Tax=Thermocatellispora tengchongensis TaxID=1073253 RepID=A0A840NW03_9ACTN|nr:hypothetical protein [Thermocatellispora tengchongensis]MBB5130989.1 ABC-type nickel/cobalt efflux system permease component RcnA [Thermocatellispora tengchongensis]